jgi:adenine-specific DNA-methyltransferase
MPTKQKLPLEILKEFLNKLFQFESQDLDFGVYKILHYKRNEIKHFIDKLLIEKVKKELQILTNEEVEKAKEKLKELEESPAITKWLKAVEEKNHEKLKIYEEDFSKEIKEYKNTKADAESADVSIETENQIYNHLTLFFSRYYDKGDFISKRRFGKNEKYVVPYNGEETHFYWANHDQYYIKSSENFRKYSFKSPKSSDPLKVHFKLTEAQIEQGNVKEDENRYFVLSENEPLIEENELSIFFEYRPLTDVEKKDIGTQNKQENLNIYAVDKLKKIIGKQALTAALWEKKDDETYLLKKLNHYTRKNNYDFFIHKNLKGFLQRELDFYIKSELINVDDLYVQETETHFSRVKHNLKSIKVFKNVADTIIEFLAQIEDFQKKLWEKKKFVLSTEWVITIDKLTGWLGEKEAEPILKETLKNKTQIEEWKELFGEDIFNDWKKLDIKNLYTIAEQAELGKDESEEKVWKKLPVDTVHFDEDFKWNLLNKLSDKIDIEENSDGLVIHSDNFHGLKELNKKFYQKVRCIHIDPPYNTETSGFLYKNSFKHSSWLTMMKDRSELSIELLSSESCNQIHIDENEYEYLYHIFDDLPIQKQGTIVWDKRNPVSGASKIATQHEYIICHSKGNIKLKSKKSNATLILDKAKELIELNNGIINDELRKEFRKWVKKNDEFTNGEKAYSEIDEKGRVFQSVHMGAPEQRTDPKFFIPLIHPVTKKPCPVPSSGWTGTPDFLKDLLDKKEIIFGKDESTQPRRKYYLDENIVGELSTVISSGKKGKINLQVLNLDFPYNHPIELYADLIWSVTENKTGIIFDYFAGSGTTFHATQLLNRDDNGNRKCILIEQGNYVYTVILPRIKKIAYSFDWKEGKPKNGSMNGLGVFLKYQKLEQYEESLENISFNLSEEAQQKALEFEEYIPKYFLEFETKNSSTLVNTESMENPWDYKLKVWDGYTYDTQKAVDLVDTFNYLIGLHIKKYITKDIDGKRYQFVYGNNNSNKKILVVWRSIKDWQKEDYEKDRETLKEELKNYEYDLLYINGQAHWENYQPVEQVFKSKMVS